jgi:hypothetical protein
MNITASRFGTSCHVLSRFVTCSPVLGPSWFLQSKQVNGFGEKRANEVRSSELGYCYGGLIDWTSIVAADDTEQSQLVFDLRKERILASRYP